MSSLFLLFLPKHLFIPPTLQTNEEIFTKVIFQQNNYMFKLEWDEKGTNCKWIKRIYKILFYDFIQ